MNKNIFQLKHLSSNQKSQILHDIFLYSDDGLSILPIFHLYFEEINFKKQFSREYEFNIINDYSFFTQLIITTKIKFIPTNCLNVVLLFPLLNGR